MRYLPGPGEFALAGAKVPTHESSGCFGYCIAQSTVARRLTDPEGFPEVLDGNHLGPPIARIIRDR